MPIKIEEKDQTRTERPVGGQEPTKVEELDIDFRVPGLSHAVVKEAEHLRVQELVKKIECHPHREAPQADFQQNNVYNPFSNNSKAMIRELGNVEFSMSSLLESRSDLLHFAGSSWSTANPAESSTNQDWIQSLSRTT